MQRTDGVESGFITIGMCYGMDDLSGILSKVKPGDELTLDNSDYYYKEKGYSKGE